jgi:ribonuclease PH
MQNTFVRSDKRLFNQLREVKITAHVTEYAEGSALVEFGKTKVLCTATFEPKGPSWLQNTGAGWVTAEYGMLPRSTHTRIKREKSMTGGRTQEISRLIGRSLRSCVDLKSLNEKQIIVDCDVLQADGGTRTAAVTGGFVALALALKKLHALNEIKSLALKNYVSAISVGLHEHNGIISPILDLNYEEDSDISTDMNFVMNNKNEFIEVQGTAEEGSFSRQQLFDLMTVAEGGCRELFNHQQKIVGDFFPLTT